MSLVDSYFPEGASEKARASLSEGSSYEDTIRTAKALEADLVVMASMTGTSWPTTCLGPMPST